MRRLLDAFVAFWSTLFQPSSERKGQKFEELIQDAVFTEEHYDLIHLTQDGTTNYIRYVKSSEYPDFKFQDKSNGKKFWVEAKYRQDSYKDKIMWASEKQLKRYKEYDEELPLFIAIGVGGFGNASYPDFLYIIPVRQIKYIGLYESFLRQYEVYNTKSKDPDHPFSSSLLWKLLSK